jgi:organic hydroperoxide reductase OsmC/OhrA
MESSREFSVELRLEEGYRFTVDFGAAGVQPLEVDEPEPLGRGAGPNAVRLLGVAVGNCLAASLLFCLERSRVAVTGLKATVEGTMLRNEQGHFRVSGITVRLQPGIATEDRSRIERCLNVFEDYCVVTQSVRDGLRVDVTVEPASAVALPG